MISEDYVSFETAKLLKEKGFNEKLLTFYITDEAKKEGCFQLMAFADDKIDNNHSDYCYLAPTLQMAMKWLREVHNLFIAIDRHYFVIDRISHIDSGFKYSIEIKTINIVYTHTNYKSYEEACEAAIKYCLKNLI